MKNSNSQYLLKLTFVATLGGLLFGYDTGVISGTVGSLDAMFVIPKGLSETAASAFKGFIVSSALIGCIIGGIFSGLVSKNFGRKKGLIIAAVLFLISAIGSAVPEMFIKPIGEADHTFSTIFIVYRIIGGIGVGLASMLSPLYIAEIAPAKNRGRLVSFNQLAIVGGFMVVYFVNYFISKIGGSDAWLNQVGWRWMFASEIIPAGLFLLFLFFVPDTPRYLMLQSKPEEALDVGAARRPDREAAFGHRLARPRMNGSSSRATVSGWSWCTMWPDSGTLTSRWLRTCARRRAISASGSPPAASQRGISDSLPAIHSTGATDAAPDRDTCPRSRVAVGNGSLCFGSARRRAVPSGRRCAQCSAQELSLPARQALVVLLQPVGHRRHVAIGGESRRRRERIQPARHLPRRAVGSSPPVCRSRRSPPPARRAAAGCRRRAARRWRQGCDPQRAPAPRARTPAPARRNRRRSRRNQ